MSIQPDKIALAVLYYLDSVQDPDGDSAGIAAALGNLATTNQVLAQLNRLYELGLAIDAGPMPVGHNDQVVGGRESWSVTHEGAKYVYRCIRQPNSFLSRLHGNGLLWLGTDEADAARLSTSLDSYSVRDVLDQREATPSIQIQNTFSPTNTNTFSPTVSQTSGSQSPDPHSRSAAVAGWVNVWVAIVIGVAAILVALWLAGKLGT